MITLNYAGSLMLSLFQSASRHAVAQSQFSTAFNSALTAMEAAGADVTLSAALILCYHLISPAGRHLLGLHKDRMSEISARQY